ncbi:MAG: hypothetical protein WBV82_25165 [Myxococcaceae bacterium]
MSRLLVATAALLALSCSSPPAPITVLVSEPDRALVEDFLEFVPFEGIVIQQSDDPEAAVDDADGVRIAIASRLECAGCDEGTFQIDGGDRRYVVRGAGALGLQYGLAEVLEAFHFRFFHPRRTHVPEALPAPLTLAGIGEPQSPEIAVRGLHMHTLHPIEGYFDFWEPGEVQLDGARRTIDWVVKNRGNYLQYPALDDVLADGSTAEAWRAHTRAILEYAHRRGVRVGVGIQLFGQSNLQKAFDLIDGEPTDVRAEMKRRLELLLRDVPFDAISLSFGEFSAADPGVFIDHVNLAAEALHELSPGIDINTVIHVGDQPELRVTWEGETLLYYFLVKFADERLVPWVHTVMYYDLFEDAGGAYHHDDFSEHRQFLLDRLEAGKPVGYFPESAYWIAFDNSVPLYLPLYAHSRWLDLERIRAARAGKPGLREHGLFSSGWEWGYWQTDYATLRMNFELPSTWRAPYEQMFAPWGERGTKLVDAIARFGTAQHEALITQRLAPYLAGRDQIMDASELKNLVAQPDRPQFFEVRAYTPEQRIAFRTDVLARLKVLADKLGEAQAEVESLAQELGGNPWFAEVRDGMTVTTARTRFVHALYSAVLEASESGSPGAWLEEASAQLAIGRSAVDRRHQDLHDPDGRRLLINRENATLYPYGYLREAQTLCFWNRERIQVEKLLLGSTESVPACVSVDL